MWFELDRFSRTLIDATLATTVLLSGMVLVMLFCEQPVRRMIVARWAIILAAVMPLLVCMNPWRDSHSLSWLSRESSGAIGSGFWAANPRLPDSREEGTASTVRTIAAGEFTHRIIRELTLVYLFGAGLAVAWNVLGLWGGARLVRGSIPPSPVTKSLYIQAAREHGLDPEEFRIAICSRIRRPVVTGARRVSILIPPAFEGGELNSESLRIVLLHELAHAREGDPQFQPLAGLCQGLWFFLPHVWWILAQLRIDREFLADQRTAEILGSRSRYATRLVGLATDSDAGKEPDVANRDRLLASLPRPGWWWAGGFRNPLLQRVVMLLHCPFPIERKSPRWWNVAVLLFSSTTALFASSWTIWSQEPNPATEDPAAFSAPVENQFRVEHFVAVPRGLVRIGRSAPHVLPVLLPERFSLHVDVEASPESLARTRLAGLPLRDWDQPPPPRSETEPSPSHAAIHRVRLERDGMLLRLSIDENRVRVNLLRDHVSEWLTIEPPADDTIILRDLSIAW
ncbi:M56 family metallopeptidase [Aquisphaera insulae]|uniref:M56 family metallopeptidase n=1 Tax=Aquisphaera insulae TaxID=2712864 RepID=UPI0013EB03EB|nr:M56 family metallopeptidase [Aquisphaera insulae]